MQLLRLGFPLFVLLLFVPSAAAQQEVDVFKNGVRYFVAHGRDGSGHVALGPGYDGKGLLPFVGCAEILVRPGRELGEVFIAGDFFNTTLAEITLREFAAGKGLQGGIATNLTIDGSELDGKALHPPVMARAAGWGTAGVVAGGFQLMDPIGASDTFAGSFWLTKQGYRDPNTLAVQTTDGAVFSPASKNGRVDADDWELHARVWSTSGGGSAKPFTYQSVGEAGADSRIVNHQPHQQAFRMSNERFGGDAVVQFYAESTAPELAGNSLRLQALSPAKETVANLTATPSLNKPSDLRATFPLHEFGNYTLLVEGKATLLNYTIRVLQLPPESFEMNFWWEDVSFEEQAFRESNACRERYASPFQTVDGSVDRPKPPRLTMEILIVAAAGVGLIGLFVSKLVIDSVSSSSFRRLFRKR